MTIKEKEIGYKSKNELLIQEVNNNSECKNKSEVSNKIMSLLRGQYIYATTGDVNEFREHGPVTIDPFSDHVIHSQPINIIECIKIFAYSFGPFDPKYFFNEDTFRIIWLLKEPLLCGIEEINKRKSGVDQASIYNKWEVIVEEKQEEGTKTKYNLIKRSQTILKEIAKLTAEEIDGILDTKLKMQLYKLKGEDLNSEDVVMKHICILEVNHFPGLALANKDSDDSKINEWAGINYELIEKLIFFYNPNIVIGGWTFGHFLPAGEKYDIDCIDIFKRIKAGELSVFHDKIVHWSYTDANTNSLVENPKIDEDNPGVMKNNYGKNARFLGESGRMYIHSYHPSNPNCSATRAKEDGYQIKKWLITTLSA